MHNTVDEFERLRPRLFAIGYRMLSSVQEAEDLVQDAWLRWYEHGGQSQSNVRNIEAWLVTMTTRMAIDRLRAARVRRESYPGFWLPEPLPENSPATPQEVSELADDVSVAFLVLLDRLSPDARAAFLLREVFDADFEQVAEVLGKSEAAARQVVHRARRELEKGRETSSATYGHTARHEEQQQVLRSFAEALSRGDFTALQALFHEKAELLSDGGGIVPSFGQVILGVRRLAAFYFAWHRKYGSAMRVELARLNHQWALLRYIDGRLESAQSFEVEDGRIHRVHVQRNPHKLTQLPERI